MNPNHMLTTDAEEFIIKSVVATSSENTAGTLMNEWGIFGAAQACLRIRAYDDDDWMDGIINLHATNEGFLVTKRDFRYAISQYIEKNGSL
jgi:hypothetical protein